MTGKPWYRSRTIWLNTIGGLVALAAQVPAMLAPFDLPADWQGAIAKGAALALLAGNIVLRLVTVEPIKGVGE